MVGLYSIIKNIFKNKFNLKNHSFIILNLLIIFYFYLFAGGYGVSRYFVPTLICYSFFFALGIEFILRKK